MVAETFIFAPYLAEAKIIAAGLPGCRKKTGNSWNFKGGELATINNCGMEPMQNFFAGFNRWECFSRFWLFGSAGAIDENSELGQVFICNRFLSQNAVIESNSGSMPTALKNSIATAVSFTVDEPVMTPADRKILHLSSGAGLVDMESFHFAKIMNEQKMDFMVIRFVSDTASTPFSLPFAPQIVKRANLELKKIISCLLR